jgi:hypothetical protein
VRESILPSHFAFALSVGVFALANLTFASTAVAQELTGTDAQIFAPDVPPFLPRTTFGEVGILEMPTSRMAPDGEFSFGASLLKDTQRYDLGFQALPWFEATFRYSIINNFQPHFTLDDRSFSAKIRLSNEDEYLPEVSMGIRDLLGTGVYGAEYFVASKQIGDFDVSAGLGWGRLASNGTFQNPFALLIPSFRTRQGFSGQGGVINFGEFFHGPDMGLFGGVIWRTPIDGLDALVEYSSDNYTQERSGGGLNARMPVNFGLAYEAWDGVAIEGAWLYGTSYGLVLNVETDPTKRSFPASLGAPPPPAAVRSDKQQADAVYNLVDPDNELNTLEIGRPRRAGADPYGDAVASLAEELRNGGAAHDFEISGTTLFVNAHSTAGLQHQCEFYARARALPRLGIKSVAVADLNDPSGNAAVCDAASETIPGWLSVISLATADPGDTSAYPAIGPLVRIVDNVSPPSTDTGGLGVITISNDMAAIERKIRSSADAQSIRIDSMGSSASEIWVYFENTTYFFEAEAIGRLSRVLMQDAPPNIEIFHLVSMDHGIPLRETEIVRSALERSVVADGGAVELGDGISLKPAAMDNPHLDAENSENFPHFSWSISPETRESLFDPLQPFEFQILVAATGAVDVAPGLTLSSTIDANVYNNFKLNRPSNSLLPHVRSDIEEYYRHGINGISDLTAQYRTRLAPDVFAEIEAGYLEDMFGGAGGQVLWRPDNSRIAVGVDLYDVWQRDFNRLFGFMPYHVVTGHLSLYYESPWHGVNFDVHMGRYLAGDYGGTFQITRRFDTGVEIGFFATFTNVPFSKFGEGSFDKGLIIRIPLEWALPFHTQSSYDLDLRPLTRDGGQRLENDDSLYDETRRTGYGEINEDINDVVWP